MNDAPYEDQAKALATTREQAVMNLTSLLKERASVNEILLRVKRARGFATTKPHKEPNEWERAYEAYSFFEDGTT